MPGRRPPIHSTCGAVSQYCGEKKKKALHGPAKKGFPDCREGGRGRKNQG